jgi:hypothetical protein
MRTCDIDGCDNKHSARGLCKAHYKQQVRSGELVPADRGVTKQQYLDAIAAAHVGGWITFGCIPAPGSRDKDGYGRVKVEGKGCSAHNYTLRQTAGPPPPDKPEAAHACRGKGCANPAHLSWKDRQGNADDMRRDGTRSRIVGEFNGSAKLTADDVREMIRLYAGGGWTYARLGERYGVHVNTVGHILRGERWSHIER